MPLARTPQERLLSIAASYLVDFEERAELAADGRLALCLHLLKPDTKFSICWNQEHN